MGGPQDPGLACETQAERTFWETAFLTKGTDLAGVALLPVPARVQRQPVTLVGPRAKAESGRDGSLVWVLVDTTEL